MEKDDFFPEEEIMMEIVSPENLSHGGSGMVDIFVFEEDGMMRLDSYQRLGMKTGNISFAASGNGKKRIVALLNSRSGIYSWTDVSSYHSMKGKKAYIYQEDISGFLMCGEGQAEAGLESITRIEVSPFVSEINVRSLKCDFRGKPYEGSQLENVRIYLINVNSDVPLLHDGSPIPTSYVNMFRLDSVQINSFLCPDMIFREMDSPVGSTTVYPDISLYCYPNGSTEESSGSPFTRLVIEGEINGMKCFYPVSINQNSTDGTGIGRNCRYIYDMTITGMGTSDPDIEAGLSEICISCQIEPWKEEGETGIIF